MADKDTLPAVHHMAEVAVYEPPSSFEVVDRGAPEVIKFEIFGTWFQGIFHRLDDLVDDDGEHFTMAILTGADGKPYGIYAKNALLRALEHCKEGDWVRITYDRDIPMKPPKSPMKSFLVERGV